MSDYEQKSMIFREDVRLRINAAPLNLSAEISCNFQTLFCVCDFSKYDK